MLGPHGPHPECPVSRGVQETLSAVDRKVADVVKAELGRFTVHDVLAHNLEQR